MVAVGATVAALALSGMVTSSLPVAGAWLDVLAVLVIGLPVTATALAWWIDRRP